MIPIAKNIKRYFSLKVAAALVPILISLVFIGAGMINSFQKDVTVYCDGKLSEIKTMKTTVQEVLAENDIAVNPEDYINLPLDSKLHKKSKNEIFIKKAIPVKIIADGKTKLFRTYKNTVGEVLKDSGTVLAKKDRLDALKPDDEIKKDMNIKVIRVTEKQLKEKIPVPFTTVKRDNYSMNLGAEKLVSKGEEGIKEKFYKIIMENGKEVARTLIKEAIILQPVARVIERGTVSMYKTVRGDALRYSKVLNMRASAYSLTFRETGKRPGDKYFGITATGMDITKISRGVIAVDPRVIPLGTKVYVEVAGNTPDYGFAIAADRGGGIKGNRVDLFFSDTSISRSWGCKNVRVYILIK